MGSRLLLLLLLPTALFAQQSHLAVSAGDLYKTASPSVVLIQTYADDGKVKAAGSGFLISTDGVILTNYHVIAHSKKATVRLANQDAYDDVEVLDIDKRKDIALIKIKALNLPHLTLGKSSTAQIGDKVYALGNPLGVFQNTLSEGIISSIRQADGYRLFQVTAPISHGSSGGPVFDTSGDVVGIVDLTVEEGQNLNFALPIDYAAGLLGSKTPQQLASIYEPEPPTSEEPAVAQPTPTAAPSAAFKNDAFTYLGEKVGIWTKEDAEKELGSPVARRDAFFKNAIVGDIYKYPCPQAGFATVELNFNKDSKRLVAAYFYYGNLVSWPTVRAKLGRRYKKVKMDSGQPGYLYQFQQRQVFIVVDSADNVVNIGIW